MALGRRKGGQTSRERGLLRRHLKALAERREGTLRDLGGLALEMYRRDNFDSRLLWKKAAEIAAVDDEMRLLERGLEEHRSVDELQEMARNAARADREADAQGPRTAPSPRR
jgi:hypothetical protein